MWKAGCERTVRQSAQGRNSEFHRNFRTVWGARTSGPGIGYFEAESGRIGQPPAGDGVAENRKEINEEIEFNDIIKLLLDKDIILVEGYKNSNLRKIEVYRSGVSDKIITPKEKIIAVASDINLNLENIKVIDKNSIKELADLIEKENEFKFEIYQ